MRSRSPTTEGMRTPIRERAERLQKGMTQDLARRFRREHQTALHLCDSFLELSDADEFDGVPANSTIPQAETDVLQKELQGVRDRIMALHTANVVSFRLQVYHRLYHLFVTLFEGIKSFSDFLSIRMFLSSYWTTCVL